MRSLCVAVVVLAVSASAAWAGIGASHDKALAQRLVISKVDAHPLFPGYITAWHRSPCSLTTTPADQVTASATGNWGGVQIGLWSAVAVLESPAGAEDLYQRVVALEPECLLRSARSWGTPAHSGYKTHPCPTARIRPLPSERYGNESHAWRATYDTRYRTGCTVRALDGVTVRSGRAVAIYVFDNATALGRSGSLVTARDEQLIRRAVDRASG